MFRKPLVVVASFVMALTLLTANAQSSNLVQTAKRAGNFSTLVTALRATGLDRALRRGHYTVFAPTDAAFARLGRGTIRSLLRARNRGKLRAILLKHVVRGRIPSRKIRRGRTHVRSVGGRGLAVRRRGSRIRVNNARVIAADVRASNGIIHVVNRVIQ